MTLPIGDRGCARWVPVATILLVALGVAPVHAQPGPLAEEPGPASISAERGRAWLRAHPVIRVGAEVNYAPYEFRDGRGRFIGVVADYLELIRRRLGAQPRVRFEVVQLAEFSTVEERLQKHELDIVLALTPTTEREDFLAFTRPYLQYVNVIVTRDDHEFVTGLADFAKRRIAVVHGHSAQQRVARAYPSLNVTPYSDILDALMAVSTGKEDGLVDDIFPIVYNIRHRQIGNLKLATPVEKSLQASGFSIAVRKDWPALVSILGSILDTITPEEQREISQKWLSVRYESKIDYRAIWTAVGVFSVLLIAAVLWIRLLRRQRADLESARAQAEAANRAKDSFLASMSHELRTPLHAILGYAELLRDNRVAEGQARADAANTVASSGRHLLGLINDLLDLSRIRSGHLALRSSAVSLRALIDEVAAMIRIEADGKGLDFGVVTENPLPELVEVDGKRLRQVLLNLLGNAIKFTDHGAVTLIVGNEPLSGGRTHFRIIVDDTGRSIDPADRERIFAPFEQGEEGRKRESGVGLGLAISREIVQSMGGGISLTAREGGGNRFRVTLDLPLVTAQSHAQPTSKTAVGYEGPARRILVVDDQPENTGLIVQILQPLGFEVHAATSGADALAIARERPLDLVIMDLRMPEMNGFECAKALRALGGVGRVRIIAASASTEDLSRAEADGTLFARQLRKPFQRSELLAALGSEMALTWRFEPIHASSQSVARREVHASPPAEWLTEVRAFAHLGKWIRIEQCARELLARDSQYAGFVAELRAITQNFDEIRLARFIDDHLQAGEQHRPTSISGAAGDAAGG